MVDLSGYTLKENANHEINEYVLLIPFGLRRLKT
jgi:hypothetical protein